MGGQVTEPVTGWAVVDVNSEIDARTVSPTRRAAIVNWLTVSCRLFITTRHTDDDIENIWNNYKGSVEVYQVTVKLT